MSAITFDTHAHIKRLKEKGVTEQQAEAFVDLVKDMQDTDKSALATKADLAELKAELIKWMFTGFLAIIGLLVAVLFKLH